MVKQALVIDYCITCRKVPMTKCLGILEVLRHFWVSFSPSLILYAHFFYLIHKKTGKNASIQIFLTDDVSDNMVQKVAFFIAYYITFVPLDNTSPSLTKYLESATVTRSN